MKPVEKYHTAPHKIPCDCLTCEQLRRVQADAYGEGHQDGYLKGKQAGEQALQSRYDYPDKTGS